MHSSVFESEIGYITIKEEDGLVVAIFFHYEEECPSPLTERAKKEVLEYLEGRRREFTVPVKAEGTPFQKKAWDAIASIPYGSTLSYKGIGEKIGSKGYQAIGSACGKNPIPIIIPCHRVVGKDNIGGFSSPIEIKKTLLKLEASI